MFLPNESQMVMSNESDPLTFEHFIYLAHVMPKKEETTSTSEDSYIPPRIDIDANNVAFKFICFDDFLKYLVTCVMAGIKKV